MSDIIIVITKRVLFNKNLRQGYFMTIKIDNINYGDNKGRIIFRIDNNDK